MRLPNPKPEQIYPEPILILTLTSALPFQYLVDEQVIQDTLQVG
jgi:hypothetical protein